jgi:hypothetical protein
MVKNLITLDNLDADFIFSSGKIRNESIIIGVGLPSSNPSVINKKWLWLNSVNNKITHYWTGGLWALINYDKAIRSTTTATTLTANDDTVVFTTIITQPLPTSIVNKILNLKYGNNSGLLTITGHIDGIAGSTIKIGVKNSITIHGDGTTWWVI